MSLRRILALLVLVLALGTYLVVYELPKAERESRKEKLLGVDKDAITGVALVYPDREIELRRDDQGWRLVKPVDAAADDPIVQALLTALTGAEVQKSLEDLPADLAPFGLDRPSVTARVTLKDGSQSPPIAVGRNTAIGGKTYVRKGEEPKLYLTAASLQFGLNKQAKDLRDKTLVSYQDDDVTRVDIAPADGPPVALVRKDRDAWTVEPGGQPADPTEVRSYLSSLRATRATDFAADAPTDLAQYGLTTPRLAITVTTSKEGSAPQSKRLLFGGERTEGSQKQVYARRDDQPTVYALGDWTVKSLGKTAAQFRDKTVLGFEPVRVGRAALARRAGEGATVARAEGGGWKLEGAEGEVRNDAVQRLLDDLRDLRGADIAAEPAKNLADFGLDRPDLSIALLDKEGQPMGTVLLAKHGGKYYAMREGGQTVFEVRDYMYTRLDKQRADLTATPGEAGGANAPADTPPADEDEVGADEPAEDEEE